MIDGSRRNLDDLRRDFINRRKGALALPITGIVVYSVAALLSLVLDSEWHNVALALCFWTIPPLGAFIMKLRGETSAPPAENPLFGLSSLGRIMALSTWAIHIPIWLHAPALLPLSMGIGFALHWVIFGWTLDHPVGLVHLATRILFVIAAWHFVPDNRMGAVAAGIVGAYCISAVWLSRIDWNAHFARPT